MFPTLIDKLSRREDLGSPQVSSLGSGHSSCSLLPRYLNRH